MTPSQAAASCRPCAHRSGHMTCLEPVKAGLAEQWCITWAPLNYQRKCPAYQPKAKQ